MCSEMCSLHLKSMVLIGDPSHSMCGKKMWELDFYINMLTYTHYSDLWGRFLSLGFYFEILEPKL